MRYITLLLLIAAAINAQQSPEFEVASLKASKNGGRVACAGGPRSNDPTMFRCENMPLSGYLTRAYGLGPYDLVGPDWVRTQAFDVTAKLPSGATQEQFQAMLQNLLAHRLGVVAHYETRPMEVYLLRLPPNGAKAKLKEWVAPADGEQPRQSGASTGDDGLAVRRMVGWSLDTAISWFAIELGRPVVNETGLTGRYDMELHYVPASAKDDAGPSLPDAVREQLGLILQSVKRPMRVLVVDRAERVPTEN